MHESAQKSLSSSEELRFGACHAVVRRVSGVYWFSWFRPEPLEESLVLAKRGFVNSESSAAAMPGMCSFLPVRSVGRTNLGAAENCVCVRVRNPSVVDSWISMLPLEGRSRPVLRERRLTTMTTTMITITMTPAAMPMPIPIVAELPEDAAAAVVLPPCVRDEVAWVLVVVTVVAVVVVACVVTASEQFTPTKLPVHAHA